MPIETQDGHVHERRPQDAIFGHLKNGVDKDMNVNGSITAVDFKYICPVGKVVFLYRMNILITDAAMKIDKFGGLAALSTGVVVGFYDSEDNILLDPLDGDTIKTNEDFSFLAGVDATIQVGAGLDSLPIRWTFTRSVGGPFRLNAGEYIQFKVQDNLSTVSSFHAIVQGISIAI